MLVDDATLDVVEVHDRLRYANGRGRVFIPNPVVALHDPSLEDQDDSADAVPEEAYERVILFDLDGSGYLTGPYVTTEPTSSRAFEPSSLQFKYDRSDDRFEEVMAYYHIDAYQRYIQRLGFDNVANGQIPVNVNGLADDNSYYQPPSPSDPPDYLGSITFGSGGVDDAEDADIILHEYGHAIQDDIVPGFGELYEAAAMGEGISDYLPGSYFADDYDPYWPELIGEWDATSYNLRRPAYLRPLDSSLVYPNDMMPDGKPDEHHDGQIYSSALWSVRSALVETLGYVDGQIAADRLVIESMFYMTADATFLEGREAMLLADDALYGGAFADAIEAAFDARGITPPEPINGDLFTRDEIPDLLIPDNATVTSTIEVTSDVVITALAVTVDITHTYIGDLEIWVYSPGGRSVMLHDREGGGNDNLHATYFDDVQDGAGPLDCLLGTQSLGTWTLHVKDCEADDVGTLNWWQIEIAPKASLPPPVITTNGGEDFVSQEPVVQLAGTTSAGTIQIEVNGSTDGVTFEPGSTEWTYDGPLAEGENQFAVVAIGAAAESEPASIMVTYDPVVYSKYDINRDGTVNATDLQRAINVALGLPPLAGDASADVNDDGTVDAADVQLCVNAALGL